MKTIITPLRIAAAIRTIPATLALAFMVAVPRTTAQAEPVRQEAGLAQHKAALLRSWHEQRLQPYDPLAAARLALNGFMVTSPSRLAGEEGYYRANFDSMLLPHPRRSHGQWDCGDCTARALLAWPALREMTGDPQTGKAVELGQESFLLSLLHPATGLVFVPERSEPSKGRYYYHLWDQSRTLRALIRWHETKPADRERLRPLIERMIAGLGKLAGVRGTDAQWGPYAGFTSDSFVNDEPFAESQWVFVRGGLCVEPLVRWTELTGDASALDLALRFANCALGGHGAGDAAANGEPQARFGSDGSFNGHLHSKTSTLIGLAKLGRHLLTHGQPDNGKRYLLAARRSYDWLFTPACGASLTGWVPEHPGTRHSETCCAADALELAEVLASCAELAPEFRDWAGLHDDIERMAVNVPAVTQIRFTPELVNYLQACYGPDAPAQLDLARKFNGTWSATFFPNDLGRQDEVILGGCCQYSGVSTLYTGWHDALQWADGTLQVNYFLTRSSPQAEITTVQPARGEARIRLRQSCVVRVRVPTWLAPGKMRFSIDGRELQTTGLVDATGRFVSLGPCEAGACVDIHFPMEERTTSEHMGGKTITARWRGNYVVRMEPVGDFLPLFATAGADMVTAQAPKALAQALRKRMPVTVSYGGGDLDFTESAPGVLQNRTGDLVTEIHYEYDAPMHALRYQVVFANSGSSPISGITLRPLELKFVTAPPQVRPRARYFTGSFHYDATYPPRAFQEVERVFMGNDHCKPLEIAGSPFDYVPMIQFAVGPDTALSGLTAAFEWSGTFKYEAGWDAYSFTGEPLSDFHLNGSMELGNFTVPPGKTVEAPRVHLVFFEGDGWTPLENATRRYISERVAYRAGGKSHVNKVTYDHWFGIHSGFDLPDMMRQAKRASELGCEYFCVDASWYGRGAFGASGKGEWDQPDPVKFPGGKADFKKLSDYVRSLGMGFGIWHQVETRNGAGPGLDFNVERERGIILETLRNWIKEYHLTWMRWEMAGGGDLNYINHYHEIMAALTHEFPDLNIECCLGGGTRFDLGMIRYCTSTWLSDHTGNADVSRFNQTGALHFWPSHLLNLAVRVHRKTGDTEATAYNLISRMPGALSFNGDIAQWTPEATQRMRVLVDACKAVRQFQSQPVIYPLPQPRNPRQWDAVCFGDGTGGAQLLYAFRMEGPEKQFVELPDAKGHWLLVMSSDDNVKIESSGNGFVLSMPPNTAAVWIRK